MLIDAANEAPRLLDLIGDGGLATVVTTHQHRDHWVPWRRWSTPTGAPPSLAHADAAANRAAGVPIAAEVAEGDTVPVGDCALEVIHLDGHTPGSIALLYRDPDGHPHLFTGDRLFPGGVGNTDGDPAAFAQLIDDVERQALRPAAGRDLVLPRPRQGLHARRRAAAPAEWRDRGW